MELAITFLVVFVLVMAFTVMIIGGISIWRERTHRKQ